MFQFNCLHINFRPINVKRQKNHSHDRWKQFTLQLRQQSIVQSCICATFPINGWESL
jgi:hypothetical protein